MKEQTRVATAVAVVCAALLVAAAVDLDMSRFSFNTGTLVVLSLAALGIGAALVGWLRSANTDATPTPRKPIRNSKDAWAHAWDNFKSRLVGITGAVILLLGVMVYVDYVEPFLQRVFGW